MFGDRPANERGQLLVITALVLAVVLVGLGLVLNSAIYTENLSTRQSTDSIGAATAIGMGHAEIERTIHHVNRYNNSSEDEVNRAFDDTVSDISNHTTDEYAKRGTSYRFEVTDRTNGTHLKHTNSSKSFVSGGTDSDKGNWTLAGSVSNLRGYRMSVQPRYLYNSSNDTLDLLIDNTFHVSMTGQDADGNTVTWEIHMYEDDDTGDVVVFGAEESDLLNADTVSDLATFESGCRVSVASDSETVTIDITNGTVGGNPCGGLEFQDSFDSAISIRYENADEDMLNNPRSGGTYELVIGTTSYEQNNFYDTGYDQSPYATHIIYSVRVESHYARADIAHSRTIRLYPGIETYVV